MRKHVHITPLIVNVACWFKRITNLQKIVFYLLHNTWILSKLLVQSVQISQGGREGKTFLILSKLFLSKSGGQVGRVEVF